MRISKPQKRSRLSLIITIILLVLVAAAISYYYFQKKAADQRQQQYGSSTTTPTENVSTPSSSTTSSSSSGGSITSSKDASTSTTTAPSIDTSVTPQTPVGTFVSNHRPNLSGSPAPNTMNSTCRTTLGAVCTISFTNGETTVSLPEKTTDANGNVSWDWKLQDINIGKGSWTVKAVAKNGSKTAESTDPIKLEVGP